MAISTWKSKAESSGSRGELPFLEFKADGRYVLRFFPITHKITEADYLIGRYPKGAIGDTAIELCATRRIHFKPFHDCPEFTGAEGHSATCERCDAAREIMDNPALDKATKDSARRDGLATVQNCFVVICISEPRGAKGPSDGYLVFDSSAKSIVQELATIESEFDIKKKSPWGWMGRDISITKNAAAKNPQDVYKIRVVDSEDNTTLSPALVNNALPPDLFSMPRYAPPTMRHLFKGKVEEEAPPAPAPAKKAASRKAAAPPAKAPWPPVQGQTATLLFDDGSSTDCLIAADQGDGKYNVTYSIDGVDHEADVTLEDIKAKG